MSDVARVAGWFYMITMLLFVLFFGVSLLLRGVWWSFLWPSAIIAALYVSEQPL
jgi:hypothetical protein